MHQQNRNPVGSPNEDAIIRFATATLRVGAAIPSCIRLASAASSSRSRSCSTSFNRRTRTSEFTRIFNAFSACWGKHGSGKTHQHSLVAMCVLMLGEEMDGQAWKYAVTQHDGQHERATRYHIKQTHSAGDVWRRISFTNAARYSVWLIRLVCIP